MSTVQPTASAPAGPRPRIAVFAGPTATVMNSAPLVTSNQARRRHGLPLLRDAWGNELADVLRPQRLAKPVTVYVEQFSAHPLEADAADLYGPPDGYLDQTGEFHRERRSPTDIPVFEVELRPEDGLFPLPYMARQRDGSAWDGDAVRPGASPAESRQPFYPDASRIVEEIDRLGVGEHGTGGLLATLADYDHFRVLPSGGYSRGLPAKRRTDVGEGDVTPERIWEDYFPYRPSHLRREPPRPLLAKLTNDVQAAMSTGRYRGGVWLEGSPFVEETAYWLNLLIDTTVPIVGVASADWPHGVLAAAGDRHLVDAVRYLTSGIWQDADGRDRIGVVVIQAEQIFTSRDVQKGDARPGGFVATGGHGGIVGTMGEPGPPLLTNVPVWRHTSCSQVRVSRLPERVPGLGGAAVEVVRDGRLVGDAIPQVSIVKHARYSADGATAGTEPEVELLARIDRNRGSAGLAGFVVEGGAPYGSANPSADAALRRATFLGMPVVRVGRGNAEGFVAHERVRLGIAGSNLTATKARLLLMACLLRFGAPPPAIDPDNPSADEIRATEQALVRFQHVFDTH